VSDSVRPAAASESFVQDDARQPGADAGVPAELGQVREGAPIGGLQDIFRLEVVPHHAAGDAIEASVAKANDGVHCRRIIVFGTPDQVCFVSRMGHYCTLAPRE